MDRANRLCMPRRWKPRRPQCRMPKQVTLRQHRENRCSQYVVAGIHAIRLRMRRGHFSEYRAQVDPVARRCGRAFPRVRAGRDRKLCPVRRYPLRFRSRRGARVPGRRQFAVLQFSRRCGRSMRRRLSGRRFCGRKSATAAAISKASAVGKRSRTACCICSALLTLMISAPTGCGRSLAVMSVTAAPASKAA